MRLLGAVFATVLIAISVPASAKTRPATKRVKAPPPALTAEQQSFQAFGTKFCNPDTFGCEQTVPRAAMSAPTAPPEHGPRAVIWKVSVCAHPETTGKNCDVAWAPPQPAQPWRDAPEIRTGDVMPRPL